MKMMPNYSTKSFSKFGSLRGIDQHNLILMMQMKHSVMVAITSTTFRIRNSRSSPWTPCSSIERIIVCLKKESNNWSGLIDLWKIIANLRTPNSLLLVCTFSQGSMITIKILSNFGTKITQASFWIMSIHTRITFNLLVVPTSTDHKFVVHCLLCTITSPYLS